MRKLLFVLTVGGAVFTVGLGAEAMPAAGISPVPVQAVAAGGPVVQSVQYYRRPYYRRPYRRCYYRHHRRYCY